jgi:hypothetical protein
MPKLHELLAAEKTPTGAWNQLYEDTLKKFKNPAHFFQGHSKSLQMITESPENAATEAQNRDEKPVTTTVLDTLQYALDIFAKAEDLQYQKNKTNTRALGTVNFRGAPILLDLPVDELLGLENRLTKIRLLFEAIPTLDATKDWIDSPMRDVWVTKYPEDTVKTEKIVVPVVMSPATDKHPAQVQAIGKDVVVGKFTQVKRSGEATAQQKADMLKVVDELIVEVKQARMRANETDAITDKIASRIVALLIEPLQAE